MIKKTYTLVLSLTIIVSLAGRSAEAQRIADLSAQQIPDTSFNPPVENPAYPPGRGPTIFVDEAHLNFHTAEGRYKPFAELLRRDGYVVKASTVQFGKETLRGMKILVSVNPLAERNRNDWSLPTPSAFTDQEIAAVREWVKKGGSLLLIADHMPFPGAVEKLAAAFGVRFNNGYVRDEKLGTGRITFRRSDGSLADHPITNGRTAKERVDAVATFTGSAFQSDKGAQPLFTLGPAAVSLMTSTVVIDQFPPNTPRAPVGGWLQGAVLQYGKGRVAVFGEAAMFTAQVAGPNREPRGMNAPGAKEAQNPQFLLNVMHWLSGLL